MTRTPVDSTLHIGPDTGRDIGRNIGRDLGPPTVVIIGAGFSGIMTAVQLLRRARRPMRIVLTERAASAAPLARWGAGVAYSTESLLHVLNVPAGRMSALPEDPDHFLAWARQRDAQVTERCFVPRRLYGTYLESLLRDTAQQARCGVDLVRIPAEVTAIHPGLPGNRLRVELAGWSPVEAHAVVLATGNGKPEIPAAIAPQAAASPRFVRNPWDLGQLGAIEPGARVLVLGTGLTMIDAALFLRARGVDLIAISRRGLMPMAHAAPAPQGQNPGYHLPADFAARAWSLLELVRFVRRECAAVQARGGNWRMVIDALRPHTQALWTQWSLRDRRRFCAHVARYWDCHRHRAAPHVAAAMAELRAEGRLRVVAGRIERMDAGEQGFRVTIRPRGEAQSRMLEIDWVINCSGPTALGRTRLLEQLTTAGLVSVDPLGLGLRATPAGHALSATGSAALPIYLIGPLRKGDLWESTAVPELRQQAEDVARRLLVSLARGARAGARELARPHAGLDG